MAHNPVGLKRCPETELHSVGQMMAAWNLYLTVLGSPK
jgi:hypothetical protein